MSNKKYGLILPDRGKPVFQASRNVFGNDSDSEEEANKSKKSLLLRPSDNTARQAKINQEKAMLEDPTVYQYDEIYDDMTTKKEKTNVKSKIDQKPQYIEKLLKAANKRKLENERRIERQIQKEREKEGDEFVDKEVFVTSAYKKKLEEMRLEEEKEKREEYLENIGDVTKQRDLGGFYRHIYEQKLGKEIKSKDDEDSTVNDPEVSDKKETPKQPIKVQESQMKKEKEKRNYRKRKSSDARPILSDGEIEESDEEINRVNLDDIRKAKKYKQDNIDADSDFSIDESSSDDETDKKTEDIKQPTNRHIEKEQEKPSSPEADCKSKCNKKTTHESKDNNNKVEVPKPKVDIWKKRTVGPVFEEALRRYYERKSARGC